MEPKRQPFEVAYDVIAAAPEEFIEAVFSNLQSSFLILPLGPGFVSYQRFSEAYEVLKRATSGFAQVEVDQVLHALEQDALSLVVLRTILGLSPPELAYAADETSEVRVSQSFGRMIDREVRENAGFLHTCTPLTRERIRAIIAAACQMIVGGAPDVLPGMLHRLDKADTRLGQRSLEHLADEGVSYAMLLYERLLGRPFASHRDAVSGIVGEVMENAVEAQLRKHRITFRRTQRAESIEGFDQAPDFIVPDEWNPRIVIEAKSAEDDGTARDKVTRIQHLASIAAGRAEKGLLPFYVIACIDGRGFGVRREDMRKLLEATRGKVFTLRTLDHLVAYTDLNRYASANA